MVVCRNNLISSCGFEGNSEANFDVLVFLFISCEEVISLKLAHYRWEDNDSKSKGFDQIEELLVILENVAIEAHFFPVFEHIASVLVREQASNHADVELWITLERECKLDYKVTLGLRGKLFELAPHVDLFIFQVLDSKFKERAHTNPKLGEISYDLLGNVALMEDDLNVATPSTCREPV